MSNEKDSNDEIGKSTSSTSEVVDSTDLTTSIEPNILSSEPQSDENEEITLEENVQEPTTSTRNFTDASSIDEPDVSRLTSSQPNLGTPKADVYLVRTPAGGLVNSTNAMHGEIFLKKVSSKKSVKRIPPSYSTVLKLGPALSDFASDAYPSIPFITRQPPPSYAEVHGGWDENPSIVSADSYSLGPNPLYISCPRCRTIVISDIHTERSNLSYIISAVLCVCLCWPCCLLPFCLKSCRNTYHFCPTCHYYLGVYRPC
ncbi:uncharacterized protein LOC109535859 isoform X1 [Dendroctonus ponderosae]|uniref:LITAF domain-containing protein n=1 Tax=Dendroctonus ponderosae TaxID=77166 RepID=U4UCB5_DENPD|nr:uncharacterized protein LOC109535859 isoform X1 [Dendroctonus ponderosae]ERL88241.1 hypothetical protein D910_05629 [Dendroctonus ponderosae]KAH1008314.1 hypothetical protein HUJ05_008880 [Dendroctonus ponderosae]